MSEILLIRHPETDLAGRFCGHSNPLINTAGHAQLEALLETLANEKLEAVYTSDLQRAETLAEAIATAHRIPFIIRPALREIHFGDWEALSWAQIEQSNPEQAATWLAAFPHEPAPNGELFADFQARILDELDSILRTPQECIAIVTHAGVIRTMLTTRMNLDEETAWSLTKPYCCLIRCRSSGATLCEAEMESRRG
jgi:alpha-ribazole phosphatase/probable phosphoglycerate mutase